MPAHPDCIVIGGGVIGMTIAWRLADDGLRVTLIERSTCGREASWAGAGVLSPPNPHRRDPAALLHLRSMEMYPAFCAALDDASGIDPEYTPCGELALIFDKAAMIAATDDVLAADGLHTPDGTPYFRFRKPEEVQSLEPAVGSGILAAVECPVAAQVRNPRLLRALHQACIARGVDVREGTAAHDFLFDQQRVTGVATTSGDLPARWTILCAGAWSNSINERLSSLMPIHPVRGQMILLKTESHPFTRILSRGKTYLVPRHDGHILLGSTEEPEAGFQRRVTAAGLSMLMQRAIEIAPCIAAADFVTAWAGFRPGTPDDLPYLGPIPGMDGLLAATGHFRTGLTLAPATADVLSALVRDESPDIDLSDCRPGRA